jgi:methyl-galactoside transport system substrate-binding protein
MNKKLIPAMALAMLSMLAACGGSKTVYTKGVNLNYALLIGQIDHNDSAARTRGIREALGTRVEAAKQKTNPNSEDPVVGKLTIAGKDYTITEVEHAEQRNTAGATWDQQTAHDTTQTWLTKHASDSWKLADGTTTKAQGINFFVSNNDGMAVGAIGASNWVEGMPIFGYDSNADALTYIKNGKIMGTINQNASDQAAGIFYAVRNAMDGLTGADVYTKGFSAAGTFGQISAKYTYNSTNKSMLVDNFAITKANVADYEGKDPKTDAASMLDKGVVAPSTAAASKKLFLSIYSKTDTFLHANVLPYMDEYAKIFSLDYSKTKVEGDGSSESSCLDQIASVDACDGYAINMITTTSTASYLDKIATKLGATEAAPTAVPVIFWNRQGTTADGAVDATVMADKRFKTVLYVGFDAQQGGTLQGQMIKQYITDNIATLTK